MFHQNYRHDIDMIIIRNLCFTLILSMIIHDAAVYRKILHYKRMPCSRESRIWEIIIFVKGIHKNEWKFLQTFSYTFCTLLLLQETHGLLKFHQGGEKRVQRNDKFGDGQVEKNEISALKWRRKRCILQFVFCFGPF